MICGFEKVQLKLAKTTCSWHFTQKKRCVLIKSVAVTQVHTHSHWLIHVQWPFRQSHLNAHTEWGLCTLHHGIQISMEAILACHPARSTEWLDCHPKWCELWRIRTGPIWPRNGWESKKGVLTCHTTSWRTFSFASLERHFRCWSNQRRISFWQGWSPFTFNESLATGEVPLDFKLGNIIPLFKPGKKDTTSPANYRGITLNSILSKALEKLVLEQIGKFLDNNQVFSESQYGFRKGRSTIDGSGRWLALGTWEELFTAVVFIDLSKAFDNVQHQTLLIMLQRYQIGGTVLKWLYIYLQGRNQRILLGNSLSEPFTSTKGHPVYPRAASLGHYCLMSMCRISQQLLTNMELLCPRLRMICPCTALVALQKKLVKSYLVRCPSKMKRSQAEVLRWIMTKPFQWL